MEDSIFTKIRKKIRSLFHKEETPVEQEIPEMQDRPESPLTAQEGAENLSLGDVPPAEPLESRWTEEYVQFLEDTDGGLPQTDRGQEASESEETWCEAGFGSEEAEDTLPEDGTDQEETQVPRSEDAEEKKE